MRHDRKEINNYLSEFHLANKVGSLHVMQASRWLVSRKCMANNDRDNVNLKTNLSQNHKINLVD